MAAVYYELLVKGNEDKIFAYLNGYLTGKKIKQGVIFCEECPFRIHELRELIRYHGDVAHIICRAGLRQTVLSAIRSAPAAYSFEVKKDRKITSASFEFKFETFSKKVAGGLKRMFTQLPAGLKLIDFQPEETIDPDAKGIERYAPAHEYQYSGEGMVAGNVETLLDFHCRLSQSDFVELEEIVLEY
jgi:hypothetical protein